MNQAAGKEAIAAVGDWVYNQIDKRKSEEALRKWE